MPFMATERWLMLGVAAGGDRQALHEVIRRHSLAVAEAVSRGEPNDLLDAAGGRPRLPRRSGRRAAGRAGARSNYTGRAARQVGEFLDEYLQPAAGRGRGRWRPRPRQRRCGYDRARWRESRLPLPLASPGQGARGLRGGRRAPPARGERSGERVRRGDAGADAPQGRRADPDQRVLVRAPGRRVSLALHHRAHRRRSSTRIPALRTRTRAELAGRAMLVRRTPPVPFECVVRGYLSGLGLGGVPRARHPGGRAAAGRDWSRARGWIRRSSRPPPRRRPATISTSPSAPWRRRWAAIWPSGSGTRASRSIAPGATTPPPRGIIIADTKFEFGTDCRRHPSPDRRGADARLLPVLAGRPLPAGSSPAQLRQAAAAGLPGRAQARRANGTARRLRRRCPRGGRRPPADATSRRSACLPGGRWRTRA